MFIKYCSVSVLSFKLLAKQSLDPMGESFFPFPDRVNLRKDLA